MEHLNPRRAATRLWAAFNKEEDIRKGITALLMSMRMQLQKGVHRTTAGRLVLEKRCEIIREEILVLISRQKNERTHTPEDIHRNRHRVRRTIRILRAYEERIANGDPAAGTLDA